MLSVKRLVKMVAGRVPLANRIPVSIASFVCSVSEKALRNKRSCEARKKRHFFEAFEHHSTQHVHKTARITYKSVEVACQPRTISTQSSKPRQQQLWCWPKHYSSPTTGHKGTDDPVPLSWPMGTLHISCVTH